MNAGADACTFKNTCHLGGLAGADGASFVAFIFSYESARKILGWRGFVRFWQPRAYSAHNNLSWTGEWEIFKMAAVRFWFLFGRALVCPFSLS